MPIQRRAGPPQWAHIRIIGLAVLGVALILLGFGRLLAVASGAGRNLDAIVVTPAPTPQRQNATSLLTLPTVPPAPNASAGPATILLLGSDRRPGEEVTPRTDAIIVLRVDPARHRAALLSLPRDLWVAIPGYSENRLNAAYLWGEHDGPPGGGMALAKATVGDLLGLPVDYVAVADFRGFIGLIDALDGVTVDVEDALTDSRFPTADHGFTTVHFEPGPQPMDGSTALTYCRVRHPDDDFARHRRQQAVLLAIAARLRERGVGNLLAADRLSGALVGFVQTDMPRDRVIDLAFAMRDLDLSSIERYSLGADAVTFGVDNDRYALLPRPGIIASLARQLLGVEP
jgi:LCP family protein required for cell wall assembly